MTSRSRSELRKLAIIACMGVLCLASCATTRTASQPAQKPQNSAVLVFEPWLAEVLTVQSQTTDDYDGLFVTHTIFNLELPQPLHIKAQTFFKDETGITVDVSPVRELVIEPNKPYIYVAHSPRLGIKRFAVYIRSVEDQTTLYPVDKPLPLKLK